MCFAFLISGSWSRATMVSLLFVFELTSTLWKRPPEGERVTRANGTSAAISRYCRARAIACAFVSALPSTLVLAPTLVMNLRASSADGDAPSSSTASSWLFATCDGSVSSAGSSSSSSSNSTAENAAPVRELTVPFMWARAVVDAAATVVVAVLMLPSLA